MIASRMSYIAVPRSPSSGDEDGCSAWAFVSLFPISRRVVKMLLGLIFLSLVSLCYSLSLRLDSRDAPYPETHGTNLPIHDPSVIKSGDSYYAYGVGVHIDIWKAASMDGPWDRIGSVLDAPALTKKGDNTSPWAPNVIEHEGTFYCYYCVSQSGSRDSAIGVATSTSPGPGGWTDHGLVVESGSGPGSQVFPFNESNTIDPSIIIVDGLGTQAYLNFGSYWSGIWQVPLGPDMLSMADSQVPDAAHLAYSPQGVHPVEGSFMTYRAPWYYLWFSHGQCCNLNSEALPAAGSEYSIRVGRSTSPRGPFLDNNGTDLLVGGGTVVYGSDGVVYAPGGEGILNDGDNDILYYHYINKTVGYSFEDTHLGFNYLSYDSGWPVAVY